MEDPLNGRERQGRRSMTWQERLRLAWEMPRLRRRERNERLAIVFVLLALIIYVLLAPALNRSPTDGDAVGPSSRPAPASRGLPKERR